MKLTPTEMIPLGQDKMLRTVYLNIASYQIKCLYLSFTYVQPPQGNVLYRHSDVINASSIRGSCFWVLLGVLLGN